MRALTLAFCTVLFSAPCFAQTPSKELQESQAQTLQMISANSVLESEVASLKNRLALAQARIESLERTNNVLTQENARVVAKLNAIQPPPQTVVIDNSAEQVNRELAANLRVQRAQAIANMFKIQPVPAQLPIVPPPAAPRSLNCTSFRVGDTVQTNCN
jgi:hypothetical protein